MSDFHCGKCQISAAENIGLLTVKDIGFTTVKYIRFTTVESVGFPQWNMSDF